MPPIYSALGADTDASDQSTAEEADSYALTPLSPSSRRRSRHIRTTSTALSLDSDEHDSDEEDEILGLMGKRKVGLDDDKVGREEGDEPPIFKGEIDADSAAEIVRRVSAPPRTVITSTSKER